MKIYQGYVTDPMKPFGFLDQYKLKDYYNHYQPVVMFGCYRSHKARQFLRNHKGLLVIFWMYMSNKKDVLGEYKPKRLFNVGVVIAIILILVSTFNFWINL